MVAVSLAHGANGADLSAAVTKFLALVDDGVAEPQDRAMLATLLHRLAETEDAKKVVLEALRVCPSNSHAPLLEIGNRLVMETGDKSFRDVLRSIIKGAK